MTGTTTTTTGSPTTTTTTGAPVTTTTTTIVTTTTTTTIAPIMTASCFVIDHTVQFKVKSKIYTNIMTFLDENNVSFLSKMDIDFTKIPTTLRGKDKSKNLVEYLANNGSNSQLISIFLNYFMSNILNIKYTSGKNLKFIFYNNSTWQTTAMEIPGYSPVTTTTTTAAQTTINITSYCSIGGDNFNATLSYSDQNIDPMFVDWGDGNTDEYTNESKKKGGWAYFINHTYVNIGEYIMTIYAPLDNSLYFRFDSENITNITFPLLASLENLQIYNAYKTTSINLSNLPGLTYLDIESNNYENTGLTSLDISNNTLLRSLYCGYNQLTSLDISNNTLLENLACNNNQLSKSVVDTILDNLISFGVSGSYFTACLQNPSITPDTTKLNNLNSIWSNVQIDCRV